MLAGEEATAAAAAAGGVRDQGSGSSAGFGGMAASAELTHAAAALAHAHANAGAQAARAEAEAEARRRVAGGVFGSMWWALAEAAPAWLDGLVEAAHARMLARWEARVLAELAAAQAAARRYVSTFL